jgi:predicted nucleotidyltransferase
MQPIDISTLTERITRHSSAKEEIVAVYLFGSAAANRLTPESDVDIGILFRRKPSALELLQLQQEFTDVLGIQADVVNLDDASPILRMQVLKYGIRVYTRDVRRVNEFFVRTINEYDDLKRVRKPIEDNILKGRIYA